MNETQNTPPQAAQAPPATRQGFLGELRDAVVPGRTFTLVIAVLLIQLGFVFSYVGAFHHPTPHGAPIAVVAPAQISGQLIGELNAIHGHPLQATAVADETAGRTLLRHDSTSGVLIVNPAGKTDALLVAGGGGAAIATAVEDVIARVEAAQHRSATVTDAVPAQPGDARGLTDFYLVVGWLIGGYLVAALLSIATRPRPATTRRAIIRLIALVPYAILSGLGGAIIVGPVLGALTGHLLAIAALGTLIVYCAAVVTMAFQVFLGTIGVALTLILFVILGNPSAGGAYQAPLLPGFWRAISPALPNGAGVEALRRIVYFGSYNITDNLLILSLYIVVAATLALTGTALLPRRDATAKPADASPNQPGHVLADRSRAIAVSPVGAQAGTPPIRGTRDRSRAGSPTSREDVLSMPFDPDIASRFTLAVPAGRWTTYGDIAEVGGDRDPMAALRAVSGSQRARGPSTITGG